METYKVIANIEELKWFYDNVVSKPIIGNLLWLVYLVEIKNLKRKKERL